jgi:predicted dehydrogenase
MIRLGVIGCGYWGEKLLRVFSSLPNVEIAFVCDQQAQRQPWVAENYPSSIFTTDYSRLIESECDAVAIATPAASHYQIAKACLNAHKHVFVEKPLALSRVKAEQLVSLAEALDLQLLAGHIFEFDPAISTIRQIIRSGKLGQIYYVDSVRNNTGFLRRDVNIVWDLVIHDISILYKILGELPQRVSAVGSCHITQGNQNVCERCQVNMTMPTDIKASVQASWLEPFKTRQLRVIGSEKSLVLEPTKDPMIHIYDQSLKPQLVAAGVSGGDRPDGHYEVSYASAEPLQVEAKAFIESILSGKATNASNAINIIGILENIQTSLDGSGEWIAVDSAGER